MNGKQPDKAIWLSPLVANEGVRVQFRVDHVHVDLGKHYRVDRKKRGEFWELIRSVCLEHNSHRVLVEGFVPDGEQETSEIVDAGRQTAAVPRLWLALCLKGYKQTGQSEMFEAIAASQGVRVKAFVDTEQALKWLRNNTTA